jgi:hypothetical protein
LIQKEQKIKYAFSPPGKKEKKRNVGEISREIGTESAKKVSIMAPVAKEGIAGGGGAGESLWSKAAAAASDSVKCPMCYVQNSRTGEG